MSRSSNSQSYRNPMALTALPERPISVRGPESVLSRGSRRHRRNRSDRGGTTYQPQNEFPIFSHTGDVEIVISVGGREQRYLLHKLYLAQCSGFFETGTSDQWSMGQELASIGETGNEEAGPARNAGRAAVMRTADGKIRWRYELDPGTREDDIPMLVQRVRPVPFMQIRG
jgi:hypothetical protein